MIYGFPKLYEDELFISALSRFAVNLGIHTDCRFMDFLYDNKFWYPSFELTTDLNKLNSKLDQFSKVNKHIVINSHTMFPLYSLFIGTEFKTKVYSALIDGKRLNVPTSQLGLKNNCLIRDNYYKYCTLCAQEMKKLYGLYYWKRTHQIVGVEVCIKHKCLLNRSSALIHKNFRYFLTPASPKNCNVTYSSFSHFIQSQDEIEFNLIVTRLIEEIFKLPDIKSPSKAQWTHFYRDLANENDLISTDKLVLDRQKLIKRLDKIFKFNWLARKSIKHEININKIVLIFNKHSQNFNYLIHVFVWASFYENPNVNEIIDRVTQYPISKLHQIDIESKIKPSVLTIRENRTRWKKILKKNSKSNISYISTMFCQEENDWFFRHDKEWFNKINIKHTEKLKPKKRKKHKKRNYIKKNWTEIDLEILNSLKNINLKKYEYLSSNRQGKVWYLNLIGKRSFSYLNWRKLPFISNFLAEYSESIPLFQIRKFSIILLKTDYSSKTTIATLLNRNSFYKNQLKIETKQFVEWITPFFSKFASLPENASDNYFGTDFEIDGVKYPELKALLSSRAACRLNFILRLFGGLKVEVED